MSGLQEENYPCPFCDKGIIEVLVRRASYKYRRTYGAGKSSILKRIGEKVVVTTEKCSECGKGAEEIEKKWVEQGVI